MILLEKRTWDDPWTIDQSSEWLLGWVATTKRWTLFNALIFHPIYFGICLWCVRLLTDPDDDIFSEGGSHIWFIWSYLILYATNTELVPFKHRTSVLFIVCWDKSFPELTHTGWMVSGAARCELKSRELEKAQRMCRDSVSSAAEDLEFCRIYKWIKRSKRVTSKPQHIRYCQISHLRMVVLRKASEHITGAGRTSGWAEVGLPRRNCMRFGEGDHNLSIWCIWLYAYIHIHTHVSSI